MAHDLRDTVVEVGRYPGWRIRSQRWLSRGGVYRVEGAGTTWGGTESWNHVLGVREL